MQPRPLRTTVIGSYPFPSWLEFCSRNLEAFGEDDVDEMVEDAVVAAIHDQVTAGLDVITDGEQTRLDFNLSFYGYLTGIAHEQKSPRLFGPPAHDQRGKHAVVGRIDAPDGLGAIREFDRLQRLAPAGPTLKASVPGPYTLSGRLLPNNEYADRYAITEALLPIVQRELIALVDAGCREITVDEPSMSCYAYKEDTARFVDIFNRTVAPIVDKCRLSTHLCFGNFKGDAVGLRRYAPMFPAFLKMNVDEIHVEMASREFAEIELIAEIAAVKDVAVGIIDVKSYYIETPEGLTINYDPALREATLKMAEAPPIDLWPFFDALQGLPLALIRGANSDLLTPRTAAEMRRRRPDMIFAEIPDRGHVPFLDEPDSLTALHQWLDRLA